MSNPRIPYQMYTDRKRLAPLRGKPLIVHVVVNIEYCPFDQAMPRGALPALHGKSPIPDVGNFAWVEYGMRVGLPRLLNLITERGITASAYMSGQSADVYASAAEAILKAGWEVVGHGWIQKSLQFEEDETAVIARTVERLERLTGKKLRGWLGPGAGETFDTPDLIKAAGIDWLSDWMVDDQPCWMRTKHGPLIAMPYTVEFNDVPLYVVQQQSSEEMLKRLETTVKVFEVEAKTHPKVLTIALHPHIMGVAHRAEILARCLDLLLARNDTIFVTGSEIADWFIAEDGTGGAAVA